MTLGEKIREARLAAGLTQEELAAKLAVSRQAVTKWEADKGMPDVGNLKAMAGLLDVSVDYLLDDGEKISFQTTREPIDLDAYEKKSPCRDKRDATCLAHNGEADAIYPLIRRKKMSKLEWAADFLVQPGIVDIIHYTDDGSAGYYLVEKGGRQYMVRVSKDYIETAELADRVDPKKFVLGEYKFKEAGYRLK